MDLAYDNDSQGAFGLGWLFFCMFELIGRVVSDDRARRAGTTSQGQVTEVSRFRWRPAYIVAISPSEEEYKSNFECWNGTNVWWAPIYFYFISYLQYFFISVLNIVLEIIFALSRQIVQIIQGRYIYSGITGFF